MVRETYPLGKSLNDFDQTVTLRKKPSMSQRVSQAQVLYDGQCPLCLKSVGILKRLDIPDPWERTVRDWGLPFKDWLAAGLLVTGGTDNPVTLHSICRTGIARYLTRQSLGGSIIYAR